jgi:hypothetical protein
MAAEIEFTPEREIQPSINDDLNSALETQIYLMSEILTFQEKNPEFYENFQESLIKSMVRAFKQINSIQNSISRQLKEVSNED